MRQPGQDGAAADVMDRTDLGHRIETVAQLRPAACPDKTMTLYGHAESLLRYRPLFIQSVVTCGAQRAAETRGHNFARFYRRC